MVMGSIGPNASTVAAHSGDTNIHAIQSEEQIKFKWSQREGDAFDGLGLDAYCRNAREGKEPCQS